MEKKRDRSNETIWNRNRWVKLRTKVWNHYSAGKFVCARCGYADQRALSLDHIEGNGAEHRRRVGSGSNLYRSLIKEGYPPGFQVLCMNCQQVKRHENNENANNENPKYHGRVRT